MKKVQSDNKPFGLKAAQKLTPGELVEWSGWWLDSSGGVNHEIYTGVLIEITKEALGGREVLYGRVLPINNNTVFEVNVFCLRRVKDKETN